MRIRRPAAITTVLAAPVLAGAVLAAPATAQPAAASTDWAMPSATGSVSAVVAGLPVPPVNLVDASSYQQGEDYYFQSADKRIKCGIITSGSGEPSVGCQGTVPPNPPLPNCPGDGSRAPGISAAPGAPARYECYTEGVYVGSPTDGSNEGGGRVLAPLSRISVGDVTCTSLGAAITCTNAGTSFTASPIGFAW